MKSIRNDIGSCIVGTILILSIIIFVCNPGHCTDYYVDYSSGYDGSNGLTESTAWKTVAMINSQSFTGPDNIKFNKGDTWRERLVIPSSGTSGNLITFTSYGTGDKPLILGSDEVIGIAGDWADQGDNVWRKTITTECKTVVFNDTDVGFSGVGPDEDYDWYWDSNNLDVYSEDNPTSYYSSIQISQRSQAIFIPSDVEYVAIENLDARHAIWAVITMAGDYSVVANCDVSQNWHAGIYVDNTGEYNEVHDCDVSYTSRQGNQAITIEGDHTKIYNNNVHDNYAEGIDAYLGATYCEIYDNFVDNGDYQKVGIYVDGATYIDIYRNYVTRSSYGISVADELETGVSNVNIYYNISYDNYNGIRFGDGGSDYNIYNNVVYGGYSAGIRMDGEFSQTNIKNNIVYDSNYQASTGVLYIEHMDGLVLDSNSYYTDWPSQTFITCEGTTYSLSQMSDYSTSWGQDLSSIAVDPLMVDSVNEDFRLRFDSPCNDAGEDLGDGSTYLCLDSSDSTFPYDTLNPDTYGWPIGAFGSTGILGGTARDVDGSAITGVSVYITAMSLAGSGTNQYPDSSIAPADQGNSLESNGQWNIYDVIDGTEYFVNLSFYDTYGDYSKIAGAEFMTAQ